MDDRTQADDGALTINIDGWEGPLDLLLGLARSQKVDLKAISILALVQQYLDFVANARQLKLELAADYLVMAAWLAYLKSGLLLPRDQQPDPSPEELALRLQLRLERLQAMREAGARLLARDRLGRDVFPRAAPEGLHLVRNPHWEVSLFDLMLGYGQIKARTAPAFHLVKARKVLTLEEALERVARLLGAAINWTDIRQFFPASSDSELQRSALASSFLAALELARQGRADLRQEAAFAPLYLRRA